MFQPCHDLPLPLEPATKDRITRRQKFDRDALLHLPIGALRKVNRTHPAGADPPHQPVRPAHGALFPVGPGSQIGNRSLHFVREGVVTVVEQQQLLHGGPNLRGHLMADVVGFPRRPIELGDLRKHLPYLVHCLRE